MINRFSRYKDKEDCHVLYENWISVKRNGGDYDEFLEDCTDEEVEVMREAFDEYGDRMRCCTNGCMSCAGEW